MQAAKKQLRKELKKRLSSLSDQEIQRQSDIVVGKILSHPKYLTSKRLSIFLSMKDEIKTFKVLKDALKTGKEVFIPKYVGPKMEMVKLYSIDDYENLPETSWHIKQPADNDDSRETALSSGGLDLILVPGLGFTKNGKRLGRGKGYYDTYIEKIENLGSKPFLLGLAFSVQICDDIPVSAHDRLIDEVIYDSAV